MSGQTRRIDVQPVGDELDVGGIVEQRRERDAGRAVVDPAHRVEEVGRGRRPGRVAGPRLRDRRRRVADRDRHAVLAEPADELGRAGQLGRDGEQPEPVEERLERRARDVGRDEEVGRVLRTVPRRREERALEVEPERLGAVGRGVRQPRPDAVGEPDERLE